MVVMDMDMVDMDMVDIVDMDMVDMDIKDMDKQGLGLKGSSVDSILSFFPGMCTHKPTTKDITSPLLWDEMGCKSRSESLRSQSSYCERPVRSKRRRMYSCHRFGASDIQCSGVLTAWSNVIIII